MQISVYLDGLARYSPEALEHAARVWMKKSKFFPALSELLEILNPPADWHALAHAAWSLVETSIRRAGIYRGAHFEQGAVGACVRETFGTWEVACKFDLDSPGWAIRRQTFLSLFPSIAQRENEPVTLRGISQIDEPYRVPALAGLPEPDPALAQIGPPTRSEAKNMLSDIRSRFQIKARGEAS